LSLGSVGRGTTIEHLEIVSCGDDGIEFFGGTVNVKWVTMLFGNDDMFDWDLGWSGKAQFLFGMKGDNTFAVDADNGFEMDSDDQKSGNLPRAHPFVYNATLIGNVKQVGTSDNSGLAGIMAKELTEGEIYNSVLANFRSGFNLQQALGTRTATGIYEAYHNWSATNGNGLQSLKVKCNVFVGCTNVLTTNASSANAGTIITSGADFTQFSVTDLNTSYAGNTLPGFSYNYTVNPATNFFSVRNDVVPNPALSVAGCPVAPNDGFFSAAPYKGAFASTGSNWLSDWSYSSVLGATQGTSPCGTDINKDGVTDVNDFILFSNAFGQSCQ